MACPFINGSQVKLRLQFVLLELNLSKFLGRFNILNITPQKDTLNTAKKSHWEDFEFLETSLQRKILFNFPMFLIFICSFCDNDSFFPLLR